jgi:branched-chain amino acid transport system substrate-binding protein
MAEATETIKIAAIFAKTGIAGKDNAPNFEGVSLAVEEINGQGGLLGRQLEVIELDNSSNSIGSKQAALKAVELDVVAVIGAAWSSHSLAIAPVLQQKQIPMISPISTNPKVTLIGNFIFRVCFTDPFQGKVMAQFAYRDLKARTAIVLTNVNSDYSIGLAEFFQKSFTQSGGKVLWEGDYKEKAIDFSTTLEKVRLLQPNVVFVPGYIQDSGLIIKQAKKMEIRSRAVIILNIGILRFLSIEVSNSKQITIVNMAQKYYQGSYQHPMMLSWFWLMLYAVLNP